ncbi:MAG: glycosyltransferase family 39 protein [Bacteroidetes bacterium]|nr:MAG: glycosyltransferase family 39 protein [Bacteroidota bacterium]
MKTTFFRPIIWLVVLILIYFPVFSHLDTLPIRKYDEARLAINAYEMLENKNLLVTTYHGKPDMWNTKPPLMIWLQALCMKWFGINELSVRLPAALASLLTFITLLVFVSKFFKNRWIGIITIFVLLTTEGFFANHATRTGDYDSLLTFFTTTSGLFFFSFTQTKKERFLYLFFFTLALAVLTKSISGLLFIPGLVIFAIWEKQILHLIRNKHFYLGILGFVFLVSGYYLLRENQNPGYLQAVWDNELGGRYLSTLERHNHGFWFYLKNLINLKFTYWYLFIPCGILIGWVHKDQKVVKLTKFSLLMVFTFILVISIGKTKLFWYDIPTYPFFALIVGISIYFVFEILNRSGWTHDKLKYNVVPFIFLFLLFLTPYKKVINCTHFPKEDNYSSNEIGYYLKTAYKGYVDVDDYFLMLEGYGAHCEFYVKMLQEKNINIRIKHHSKLDPGDKIIIHQANVKKYIEAEYDYKLLEKSGSILKYQVYERKINEG